MKLYASTDSSYVIRKGLFWDLKDSLPDGSYLLFDHRKIKRFPTSPIVKGRYVKGQREGIFLYYYIDYSSGKRESYLSSAKSYCNGILNGPYQLWYPSGEISFIGNYMQGKKDGAWIGYTKQGFLESEEIYKNDSLYSWSQFHKNGKLALKGGINLLLKTDTVKFWFDNGNIYYEGCYDHSKLKWWKKYNKEGQLVKEAMGEFRSMKNDLVDFSDTKYNCYSCLLNFDSPYNGTEVTYFNGHETEKLNYVDGVGK